MFVSRRARPVAGILLLLALTPTLAWAPQTRVRLTDEAVRFLPPSLRLALEKNRSALLRGVLQPMKTEDSPEHRAPAMNGTLDQTVAAEAAKLSKMLEEQTRFSSIAEQFGRVAHYMLDAGFPAGITPGGEQRYRHFSEFCESRRERFPVVFYGHQNDRLAEQDYRGYALDVIARSMDSDRRLASIYARHTEHGHDSDFDDRSVPFAIGSLSYSHSINDVVRVWLTVWENAHGDMGRTPYR